MMVEDGEIITCSREENAEKFWATFGAMGLTNYSFCKIKLKNIESAYIRQESIKAENLDEIFNFSKNQKTGLIP